MIKTGFWLAAGACRHLVLSPRMGAFVRSPERKPWGTTRAKTTALFLDTSLDKTSRFGLTRVVGAISLRGFGVGPRPMPRWRGLAQLVQEAEAQVLVFQPGVMLVGCPLLECAGKTCWLQTEFVLATVLE